MIIFLFIAIIGLIASLITHFSTFLGFEPSRLVFIVLNIGLFILFPFWCTCSDSMASKKYEKEVRKKALANACPRWIWVITAIFFLYGVTVIVYFCFAGWLINSHISFLELTMEKVTHGITSVHIACYAIAIPMYYYYKCLKKLTKNNK